MGKYVKQAGLLADIVKHYNKEVAWEVELEETGNGVNCKIKIDGKQAIAGQTYTKKDKSVMLSDKAITAIANLVETLAEPKYLKLEKEAPKKMSKSDFSGA